MLRASPIACAVLLLAVGAGCDDELVPLGTTKPERPPVEPPPIFVEQCESISADESNVVPRALIVLDRSGSMNDVEPAFLDSRWNTVVDAVKTMTSAHEAVLGFGLMLFPSPRSVDFCAPGEVIVPPGVNNAAQIASVFDFTSANGATPTASSLRAARDFLAADAGTTPTAVVLATDGGPNCNPFLDIETCECVVEGACALANPQPANEICLDDVATVEAAEELQAAGISTYVIGIPGSENFSGVLNRIAIAGGTARTSDGSGQRYYPANDATALADSLDAVRIRVERCQRVVEVNLAEAVSIAVSLDGQPLSRDTTRNEGYDITGTNKIELFGEACDRAVADELPVDVDICRLVPEESAVALNP